MTIENDHPGGRPTVAKDFKRGEVSPEFEKKVFTIADEVLNILKELSLENKTRIDSQQIAERMFDHKSLKGLLNDINTITEDEGIEGGCLKELSNLLLDKFTELIPSYMAAKLGELKESLHNKTLDGGSHEWIDSPFEVVKTYINSISTRNNELEDFLNQTMKHISSSEEDTTRELHLQKQRIKEDLEFENKIFSAIDGIRDGIRSSGNFNDVKSAVMNMIDDIYNRMTLKSQEDRQRLKETDKTLQEMNNRISDIQREADEIRRKSKWIEYESSHDSLTGVYNRKAYEKKMKEILADVSRYNVAASLLVCDLDLFMDINDKWGHKLGDLALKKLASLIRERMRTNDFIARYGGEEFAIILPHTDLKGACMAGERLRAYVDNAKFTYRGDTVPLTVSIGVSCCRKKDDISTVFKRADAALSMAKKSGRNKVKSEDE